MARFSFSWPVFFLIAGAIQVANIAIVWRHDPNDYLYGDSTYYAAAATSLLRDGDLDLRNQFFPKTASLAEATPELEGKISHEFGWAKGEYITLKQSPTLAVAAVPFVALFGKLGCLVCNLVVLNLLLYGMGKLGGNSCVSRLVVLVAFVTTPLWRYAFNFSPDLFLCALLVGSVWAARANRPLIGGVLAGLAVGMKLYAAPMLALLPIVTWYAATERRGVAVGALVVGGILGLAPSLAFNTWLFGAPWVTGYERQLHVENGVFSVTGHIGLFTVPPLTGLLNQILDERIGLLRTTPLWFLWPIAAGVVLSKRYAPPTGRAWVVASIGVILATLAVFAPYSGWDGTRIGSRYHFPATVFGFVLIAAAADRLFRKSDPGSLPSCESVKP